MENKYYFSVGAIFKNESHSIKEWIEHYLHHGADHFYLINDNSTDNSLEVIQKYIDNNLITLFTVNEPYYLGRQHNLYNRHILPLIKETKWLLMVDLDEYVWSQLDINLKNVLKPCEYLGQIQIRQKLFGSNGHISQPKQIVKEFTKRSFDIHEQQKYIVNSSYDFSSLNIHYADFYTNKDDIKDITKCMLINTEYFVNNHYCCQSQDFWNNVKCTRGDADNYLIRKPLDFHNYDINDVEDLGLYNQNYSLFT
jgi:hypothetical protein